MDDYVWGVVLERGMGQGGNEGLPGLASGLLKASSSKLRGQAPAQSVQV